jgi:hypothetical protein
MFKTNAVIVTTTQRLSLSDELKKKSNELTKERMIRYRERIKEKQTGKPAKVSTQKEAKEEEDAKGRMRVYWRGKKRESRARGLPCCIW